MNFSTEFWQAVQTVLETMILALVTTGLPWLGMQARQWLRERLGQQRLETAVTGLEVATRAAKSVVLAVEQAGGQTAADKKREAVEELEKLLHQEGIRLDVGRLGVLIEAAVYEELKRWQPVTAVPE